MSDPVLSQETTTENSPAPDVDQGVAKSSEHPGGKPYIHKPRTPRACSFFANGSCRNGAECRFSHDAVLIAQYQQHQQSNPQHGKNSSGYVSGSSPKNARNQQQGQTSNHHPGHHNQQPLQQGQYYIPQLQPASEPNQAVSAPATSMPNSYYPISPPFPMHPHQGQMMYLPYGAVPPQPIPHHAHQPHQQQYQHHHNHHQPQQHFHQQQHPPSGAPYKTIRISPGHPVFSIDVECVATGVQHNSRSVAQVALVDEWCRPVFNAYIKQDKPVVSYLTELTGITKEILESQGRPLADVMAELRDHLTPTAILVGQSIHKDVQWLQLAEGVDYDYMINLTHLFRVWNAQRNSYTNFSQDHCAKVWLGMGDRTNHDALTDATISMSLFNMYRQVQDYPQQMFEMQHRTLTAPRIPGFSKLHPVIDGCCMGNRSLCQCGAPFE